MAQQISVEDAFPIFRERCRELGDENLILRAQMAVLERQLATAQSELEQLRAQPQPDQTPQPLTCIDPDTLP